MIPERVRSGTSYIPIYKMKEGAQVISHYEQIPQLKDVIKCELPPIQGWTPPKAPAPVSAPSSIYKEAVLPFTATYAISNN